METKEITNINLENKIENAELDNENMSFGSVFKSMIPSVIVGSLTAAGCQEVCSEYTSNPEMITMSGMAAQLIGGWGAYLPSHFYNNKERLTDENGKVKWKEYAQDISSVIASDQVGNKVWAVSYGVANEIALRTGANPIEAGLISGASSGLVYSAFTGWAAPKVNSIVNYVKNKFKRKKI